VISDRQRAEKRGRRAELYAALFLMLRGYRITARNLLTPYSEVDILAIRGKTCALIEVKSRRTWQACEDSLTPATRRKLDAASAYIHDRYPYARRRDMRLDTVFVVGWRIRHHVDAWRPGD